MSEAASTLGEDEGILYCNSRFSEMMEAPLLPVMGGSICDCVPPSLALFGALPVVALSAESKCEVALWPATAKSCRCPCR
ncbi:MAG TPA: hypothetical protein VMK12_02650 [Anaeromyxobacteraceae bacterium]|nr:hypothetical protein [Anaeromyxobacteraceae bacterium]